uniref:Uncharacterized protein n=1 Tax=Avena sativa TaxID=4498 RepID=A0ACD5TBI9_AVESA
MHRSVGAPLVFSNSRVSPLPRSGKMADPNASFPSRTTQATTSPASLGDKVPARPTGEPSHRYRARATFTQAEKQAAGKENFQEHNISFLPGRPLKSEIPDEGGFMAMDKEVSAVIPQGSGSEPPTICEVPGELAQGNNGAYTPMVVCIGPLFERSASMERLEQYKRCCVRKLVVGEGESAAEAWSPEVHGPLLRRCFDTMTRLAPRIRASYSKQGGAMSMSNDEQLATTMVLDGCFVLHRLLKYARLATAPSGGGMAMESVEYDEWRQLFGRCWVWETVKRDLLLLSNQVPFFVLRKLLKSLRSKGNDSSGGGGQRERDDSALVNGGLQLFRSLHPHRLHSAPVRCHDVHHLLHLFYLSVDFPPSSDQQQQQPSSPERTMWVPCATELEEAGVRFRAREREHGALSFLDVTFRRRRGILEIPPLQLFDYSEPLFRNLIAFEQTYPATSGRITAYAIFMDCLLKTTDDVRLLHRCGVLVNHMNGGDKGDDAAVGFFSRLCKDTHTSADRNYLAGVMEEVNTYQRGLLNRWRAQLVTNYFTNPWVTTSVVAAVVLLALTLLQSFYAVYGYYKPVK